MGKRVMGKYIIFSCLILDLILKYLAVRGDYAVINQGISFGVIMGSEWIFWILISIIFVWLFSERMWLVLAGGVANVISRIVWGGVVDYWNFWGLFTNNLADWMIGVGVLLYALQYLYGNTDNF